LMSLSPVRGRAQNGFAGGRAKSGSSNWEGIIDWSKWQNRIWWNCQIIWVNPWS